MKKLAAILLSLILCVGTVVGCSAPPSSTSNTPAAGGSDTKVSEKLKVAMMLPGPVNDAAFNQSSYEGLVEAKKEYSIETAYSENVGTADMVSIMKNYCDMGYGLMILVGFDFADSLAEVAPKYPNVKFAIVNGEGKGDNVSGYRFDTPETGFIAGAMSALLSKEGKVGYIAGQQYTHIVDAVNGFVAGAMYANPGLTKDDVLYAYLDSWTDTVKGKETALSFIEKGAKCIVTNANAVGLGVIKTCQENNKLAVGYITDQYDVAPGTVPCSVIQDGGAVSELIIKSALDGTIKPGLNLLGAADGVIRYSDWHELGGQEVPQETKDKMKEIYAKIVDGSLLKSGILPKSAYDK